MKSSKATTVSSCSHGTRPNVFNRNSRYSIKGSLKTQVRLYAQIGEKLVTAREQNTDAYQAIESVLEWEEFVQSVQEAVAALKGRVGHSDPMDYLGDSYASIHRYCPAFLETLSFSTAQSARSSHAQLLLHAVATLREMHARTARKVPPDAPNQWMSPRWRAVIEEEASGSSGRGLNRRFYELGVMSELKNALRSGDVWVEGSRQFGRFDEYLLSTEQAKACLAKGPIDSHSGLSQAPALSLGTTY